MSDFEMVMLFNETFDFFLVGFTTFLSIVFAFLVASSFLATKLTRTLVAIAVGLFSLASAFFIAMTFFVALNISSVAEQIKMAVADGRSSLGWLNFVTYDAPFGRVLPLVSLLMAFTFVAALVFFFHQRRVATRIP